MLHEQDTTGHVTAAERTAWNGKADASDLTSHAGDSNLHLTEALKTAITNTATSVSDMKRYRLVWFTSRTQPVNVVSVQDATGYSPESYMQNALSYAAGGAFVLPLGSHALLLYKGEYNRNDNDFGLFVWGALNSDNNAGELHYKELG